jgi:hypothetical protein
LRRDQRIQSLAVARGGADATRGIRQGGARVVPQARASCDDLKLAMSDMRDRAARIGMGSGAPVRELAHASSNSIAVPSSDRSIRMMMPASSPADTPKFTTFITIPRGAISKPRDLRQKETPNSRRRRRPSRDRFTHLVSRSTLVYVKHSCDPKQGEPRPRPTAAAGASWKKFLLSRGR